MTTAIETYQNELAYHEMIKTGIGSVSMPTISGVMTPDEISDYTEEVMYSVELYGADVISRPHARNRIESVIGRTKELAMNAISSDAARSIGDRLRDWNDRMEAQERKKPPIWGQ